MVTIQFRLKTSTKTCYRFETGEKPELMTLYLKKSLVDKAGINPEKGIKVTITETEETK